MASHTFIRLTRSSSTLQKIELTVRTRLDTPIPTGKFSCIKRLRAKMKNASLVSADQEQIEKLGKELDLALEEYGVRIRMYLEIVFQCSLRCQVTSSIRLELVVETVRARLDDLDKRIQRINHENAVKGM
jgi:hypothetical protein